MINGGGRFKGPPPLKFNQDGLLWERHGLEQHKRSRGVPTSNQKRVTPRKLKKLCSSVKQNT